MRQRNVRSRAVIVTAAALTFVLAGSTVALADTGDVSDQTTTTDQAGDRAAHRHRDHPIDRPKHPVVDRLEDRRRDRVMDHPTDRPGDRPTDHPTDRPTVRPNDRPNDRPKDRPDRDDRHAIWRRCVEAAKSDVEVTDVPPEFRKICHRILWRHRAWKRCLQWVAEHTDVRPGSRREVWKLCHRILWNHDHPQ